MKLWTFFVIPFAAVSLGAILTSAAQGATILQWDFNLTSPHTTGPTSTTDSTAGTPITNLTTGAAPSITRIGGVTGVGTPTPTTFAPSYFSTTLSNSTDTNKNTSAGLCYYSASYTAGAANKTQGIQIHLSTLGYTNIVLSFDGNSASRAPNLFEVQASTTTANFTDIGTFQANTAVNTWANGNTFTLSGFGNAADVYVNIVSLQTNGAYTTLSGSSVTTSSATRYDEITFSGTPVPEPASFGIAAFAGTRLLMRRRRQM